MDAGEEKFPNIDPVEILRTADPSNVAVYSDTEFNRVGEEGGEFKVKVLHSSVTVNYPDCSVSAPPELDSYPLRLLTLLYLLRSDGVPLKGEWIPYRSLPGGLFYQPVLERDVLVPLAEEFRKDPGAFASASRLLGAEEGETGDASFTFYPFPRIRINISLWVEDEEFPAETRLLFDANSPHYLNAFELKMLAREIASRLIKVKRGQLRINDE